jgi:hypothetical protein
MKKLYLIFCMSILTIGLIANEVTIEDIIRNPQNYEKEEVTFKGIVTQYIEGTETSTAHYLIKGDFGGQIRVNTAEESPETYSKYKVTGIIYFDRKTGNFFVSEKSREPVIVVKEENKNLLINKTEQTNKDKLLLYLMIAGAALIIILIIILLLRKKTPVVTAASGESSSPKYKTEDEFQTIKINRSPDPKTMKLIPGQLKIVAGADTGKVFRIAGQPTSDGDIATIGRESVEGDGKYAHIQLKEKTVSRKQAMLIYRDGKLYVKNLSETNFTKVDGIELKPDETIEVKSNSTIKTGEVEFQYIS